MEALLKAFPGKHNTICKLGVREKKEQAISLMIVSNISAGFCIKESGFTLMEMPISGEAESLQKQALLN